eukprot:5639724-Amphidinium_carterae.1
MFNVHPLFFAIVAPHSGMPRALGKHMQGVLLQPLEPCLDLVAVVTTWAIFLDDCCSLKSKT